MISAYGHITAYRHNEWEEYLERLCLIDIFKPVLIEYKDPSDIRVVIHYILHTYSLDSDKIIMGMDWQKNKQKIFESCCAKPEKNWYEALVLLQNSAVVETIHKWLEHQDSDTFKMLCVLKDLRIEMQISANTKVLKSSGEIDYDQKYKNAEYALKLKERIKDLEQELIQNNPKLKDAVKEIKSTKKESQIIGAERFSK